MQNKIYARLLFYLFLIQSQLSPIQAQAVQHYTDRTTCHGSTGNHRVKQDTIQWEQNTCRHRNAYQIIDKRPEKILMDQTYSFMGKFKSFGLQQQIRSH